MTTYEMCTEFATKTDTEGHWMSGAKLQSLLDDGWEPFQVFFSIHDQSNGYRNCPLVWLRREVR